MEIELAGYEVIIDTEDPNWGFELRPTVDDTGKRTWYFRAETVLDWN